MPPSDAGSGVGGGSAVTPTPRAPGAGPDFCGAPRALLQLGVIDVLQFYDASKMMESAYKTLRYGGLSAAVGGLGDSSSSLLPSGGPSSPTDISAIDPHRYAIRFMDLVARTFTSSAAS